MSTIGDLKLEESQFVKRMVGLSGTPGKEEKLVHTKGIRADILKTSYRIGIMLVSLLLL
jgi:hypothetical protein